MTTLTPAPPNMGAGGPIPGGMIPVPIPRGPMAPGGAGSGLTGSDFIRIVRQRLVLIIFLWLFLIACTVVGTYLAVRYYPKYRATAYIRVQSITPVNPMDPLRPQEAREEEILRLLQDQAIAVKTPSVLDKALEAPAVRATVWFKEAQEKEAKYNEAPRDLLSDILTAEPIRDSNYLAVSATWRIQTEVPTLVNEVVDKYIAMIEEQQKSRIRKADESLSEELNRAKLLLEGKQKEIENFRTNEEVLGTSRDELKDKLLTLTAVETELQMDWAGKKAEFENLQNLKPEDLPITPQLQALLAADPRLAMLEQSYQQADEQLRQARARLGENHRIVKQLQYAADAAAQKASEERSRRILQYQTEQLDQARRSYLEAQQQLLAVQERIHEARSEQQDKDQKYNNYLRMQEEVDSLKLHYEQLLEQQTLMKMYLRQDRTVQISVQSMAIEPKRRSSPKYEIWIPAGTILGLGIAVGFALLLEIADKSVRTPRDVQRQAIAVLATIPTIEDDEIEIARVETASLDAPHSITAESFRNLRANLFFSAPAEQQATVLVTSPSGGNGKTTVAVNLAISIALTGRRVLLVDANFRRPALPKIFGEAVASTSSPLGADAITGSQGAPPGAPATVGLSNILIGQAHLDDVVISTQVPGLDVLCTGPAPPNPAELLGSNYLQEMLVDARARYDQIIFDGPPVLLVSDAMVLSSGVDGVLLVCQYRTTSRGALQRTQQQLEAIGARIFGAVLNRVETRAGGYFRKAYREFYDYHEPAEDEDRDQRKRLEGGDGTKTAKGVKDEDAKGPSAELEGPTASSSESETGEAITSAAADSPSGSFTDVESGSDMVTDLGTDLDAEIESLGGERIINEDDLTGDEDASDDPNRPQ